jgi:hypothetical protein
MSGYQVVVTGGTYYSGLESSLKFAFIYIHHIIHMLYYACKTGILNISVKNISIVHQNKFLHGNMLIKLLEIFILFVLLYNKHVSINIA